MNRMEEYQSLLHELEDTPPALEYTVQRAKARAKKARWGRGVGAPLGSVAAACLAFVLLVNVSLPFAQACGRVPLLKELAAAVAFSPSLRAAVEHDYVQPVKQTQSANGVTMAVEYLIVDQKQLNIYYSVAGDAYDYEVYGSLLDTEGTQLEGYCSSWGGTATEHSLRDITVDFSQRDMPDALKLECRIWPVDAPTASAPADSSIDMDAPPDERGDPVATLIFDLTFDPQFTEQGETVEVGRWITLNGQKLYVDRVEIYPTHIRLELKDHPDNTAWLRGLEFYLEDEKGTRYEKISNGISASGDPEGTPFFPSHRLESSYFGDAERLTVHITGAEWLDKDNEYAVLDLADGTAGDLPENILLAGVRRTGDDVLLMFAQKSDHPLASHSFHLSTWLDPEGGDHIITSSAFANSDSDQDVEREGFTIPAGYGYCWFTLKDCPWDTVRLQLAYTGYTQLDQPVQVPVK